MATKEERQRKQFAEKLLQIKGIDYDTWLDEQHQNIIKDNQDLVIMALESVLNTDSADQKEKENPNKKSEMNTSNADNSSVGKQLSDTLI